jgi:biofilm PGA synthesis lipoprotein PgaB
LQVKVSPEEWASSNSLDENRLYFNPKHDFSLGPRATFHWLTWRRYDRSFRQEFSAYAAPYWQQNHGTGGAIALSYAQHWKLGESLGFLWGITWNSQPYDGSNEPYTASICRADVGTPMKPLLFPLMVALFAAGSARAADVLVLCYHDVRDEVEGSPVQVLPDVGRFPQVTPGIATHLDADQYATSTRNLAANFDWLSGHGYHVISLQQLMDARNGHAALPDKAVLLTFDDGLRSSYTKVFPLLKAYHYPAVMAVVGAWVDLAANAKVDFGPRLYTRDDFVTWEQLRRCRIAAWSRLRRIPMTCTVAFSPIPQGNQIPAVIIPAYDAQHYETTDEYTARIRADLAHSAAEIRAKLGRAPRAIMWPYGGYNEVSNAIAASLGMSVSFTLGLPVTFPHRSFGNVGLRAIPRLVLMSNPTAENLAWSMQHLAFKSDIRAVQVDLDYIYDSDPVQQERNLSVLLERIKTLDVTQVWLQAFADPSGSNVAAAVYFPNRHLPVRADLFSRVAWQLRTRCGVEVYAWLPVLAWQLPDDGDAGPVTHRAPAGVASRVPRTAQSFPA